MVMETPKKGQNGKFSAFLKNSAEFKAKNTHLYKVIIEFNFTKPY